MRKKPMFTEPIEAWVHGPVVRDVWTAFSGRGSYPILSDDIGEAVFDLSDEEREFIVSVWDSYKCYSALKLREMTHEEDPWVRARKGYGPADWCDQEITHHFLFEYFRTNATE
jgi:uncharacterized phage-associated protein